MHPPSRREFVRYALAASAFSWLRAPSVGGIARADIPTRTSPLTFDLHTHPGAFFNAGKPGYAADSLAGTVRGMRDGALSGAFFSLVGDAPLIELTPTGVRTRGAYAPGEARREYSRQSTLLRRQLNGTPAFLATRADDLVRAHRDNRVAAFLACEGCEFLDGDPERVGLLHADGVRSLQLVHYVPSALGDLQTQPAQHQGLSPFGRAVVRECNRHRVLIDVAHASFETVRDVVARTEQPVILSHSILAMDAGRLLAARAISVEHAKLVAQTGGVIGAWPSGFNRSFDEFVDNTRRLIDSVGVDHVGLGTDMDGNLEPVFRSYDQLLTWGEALQRRGLSAAETAKVLGGNMLRVLRAVIG